MARGLDHIVHAVRDLDAAAEIYRGLGFTVGARNRHPWGTHNHIVQLPGFFIELLTLAEPDKMGSDGFSDVFAAYNRDFTARGDGLSMLVLESQDAVADEIAFRAAGIAASGVMRFEREGSKPDGTAVHVAFSLAFAEDRNALFSRFFTCQQHYPENFWNPAFQQHANGVSGIGGVVIVADAPERHLAFMQSFTGTAMIAMASAGFTISTPRGALDVMTPAAFLERFGVEAPDTQGGARLAAVRFTTTEPGLLDAAPELLGLGGLNNGGIIGPQDGMGAVLVFEARA